MMGAPSAGGIIKILAAPTRTSLPTYKSDSPAVSRLGETRGKHYEMEWKNGYKFDNTGP